MLQVEKIGPNYWVKFGTECYLHLNCCWKWGSNYRDSSLQLVERWDFSTLNLRKNPWNLVKGNYHIEKLVQMLVITPEFKMVVSSDHSFRWDELKRELFYFMKSFIIKMLIWHLIYLFLPSTTAEYESSKCWWWLINTSHCTAKNEYAQRE